MREELTDELPAREVSSFFVTGAGKRAYCSIEEGGQTHVFQFSPDQLNQLGQICLYVAHRLQQGKTAP